MEDHEQLSIWPVLLQSPVSKGLQNFVSTLNRTLTWQMALMPRKELVPRVHCCCTKSLFDVERRTQDAEEDAHVLMFTNSDVTSALRQIL